MKSVLRGASRLFDVLHAGSQSHVTQHRLGSLLVASFVGALVAVSLSRAGLLPTALQAIVPRSHFAAVDLAFTLLLLLEVIALVFSLSQSVSNSVGKQFEILSLILLRQSFKGFSSFGEPVRWIEVRGLILPMLSDAFGGLLVFVLLGVYYRFQRHQPITADMHERESFVAAKKFIAVLLLLTFLLTGLHVLWLRLCGGQSYPFFEGFYTVLIFSDILIVLISLRHSTTYSIVFRNSGFAVATVFLRLALTAPPYLNALLGIAAALFALGLTLAYNTFSPVIGGNRS